MEEQNCKCDNEVKKKEKQSFKYAIQSITFDKRSETLFTDVN